MAVYQLLTRRGAIRPRRILVEVADKTLADMLLRWFSEGIFSAQTEGASDVVRLLRALDDLPPCRLRVQGIPNDLSDYCIDGELEAGGGRCWILYTGFFAKSCLLEEVCSGIKWRGFRSLKWK